MTTIFEQLNNIEDLSFIGGSDQLLTFNCYESDGVNLLNIQTGEAKWRLCPYGEPSINMLEKDGVLLPQPPTSDAIVTTFESAMMISTFSTSTGTPPADKTIRYNNGTIASVTEIYIDNTDVYDVDQTAFFGSISLYVMVTQISNPTIYQKWTLSGTPSSSGDYIVCLVNSVTGSGTLPTGLVKISTGTSFAPDKKFSYNASVIEDVTTIYVDFTDYYSVDQSAYLASPPSDIMKVVDYSNPSVYQLWTISSQSTLSTYESYAVTFLGGSDILPSGLCYFYLVDAGAVTFSNGFTVTLSASDTVSLNGKYIQQVIVTDFFGNTFIPGQGSVLILPAIVSS